MASQADLVRRFYEAFNGGQLDDFVDTLHPHVELQTRRGLKIGRQEARAWATKSEDGDLQQHVVIEELIADRNHVVALLRKQWRWMESGELADDEEIAALFTFEDGLITRCQPFAAREEALRAAGLEAARPSKPGQ